MILQHKRSIIFVSAAVMLSIGLVSCADMDSSFTPTATQAINLTPFSSPTPTQDSATISPQVKTSTPAPTLTPTPITYTIVQGDTMLAIALRKGITLEELQAANPDIDPRLLSVGTELIIPLGERIPSVPMTPTPLPIMTSDPVCYSAADGVWCFLLITNDRSRPLENMSAQVVLTDPGGHSLAEGVAIAPLNQLRESDSMPLTVFFPGINPPGPSAIASLITAQFTPRGDSRYLNAWIELDKVEINESGLAAEVEGTFGIPKKSAASDQVWILAIAYGQQGEVVGFKKIERSDPLSPGGTNEFTLDVFSLGPQIEEVSVLIEARPQAGLDQPEEQP